MDKKDIDKKLSTNYKDYKYEYTGYKDYMKEHNLDHESIDKEVNAKKENIDHDHTYRFDFNNPNQHQHDYSFNFETEKQKTKSNVEKPDRFASVPINNFNQNNNYYNTNNNHNPSVKKAKSILAIVIIIYIFTFAIPLFFGLISEFDDGDEDFYDNSYYMDPVYDYCYALEYNDYYFLVDSISPDELTTVSVDNWKKNLENTIMENHELICGETFVENLTASQLEAVEEGYQYTYNSDATIEDARYININKVIDGEEKQDDQIMLTVIKIDGIWYLYEQNYRLVN